MKQATVTIRNHAGIHCRPSSAILAAAMHYPDHKIEVKGARGTVSLRSILDLLSLGLQCGDSVKISVTGPNEDEVCDKMSELFATEFDFV